MSIVTAPSHKPWVIIRAGIMLVLIIIVAVLLRNHQAKVQQPIVQRQVLHGALNQETKPSPEVSLILRHADDLRLTTPQRASISKLSAEWERRAGPLRAQMDSGAASFDKQLHSESHRMSVREIQDRAAPVTLSTEQWITAKRIYWERAIQILNDKQRAQIETIAAHTPLMPAAKGDSR